MDVGLECGKRLGDLVEEGRDLLGGVEGEPGVPDEFGVSAAVPVEDREAAGEGFEDGVGARVVAAGGEVDVMLAEEIGEGFGGEGREMGNVLEGGLDAADEGVFDAGMIEVGIEPLVDVEAFVGVIGPGGGDDAEFGGGSL